MNIKGEVFVDMPRTNDPLQAARSIQVLLDVQAPLESISNLSFLAHECAEHPEKTRAYLRTLDEQVEKIAAKLRQFFETGT